MTFKPGSKILGFVSLRALGLVGVDHDVSHDLGCRIPRNLLDELDPTADPLPLRKLGLGELEDVLSRHLEVNHVSDKIPTTTSE